jgi:hypothetical protein
MSRRAIAVPFVVIAGFWVIPAGSAHAAADPSPLATSGSALADFNHDGFADLAIGVPSEDVGTVADAGAVNVLYGSAARLQATSPDDQFWNQDVTGVSDAAESGDTFGSSLATGDFNNDGFADLAVGVPHEDLGAKGDAGAVNVLYGSASGLQATSPDDQFWNQDSTGVKDTAEVGDAFGSSLGSGDFNKDGFTDLAIGVDREDVGAVGDAGAMNVLYGSAAGLQPTSPDDQFWNQDITGVKDTAEVGDAFGSSLTTGDFNNDGFADVTVGVPLESVGAGAHAGAVNVLYGSASELQATSPDDQFLNQDSTGVEDTAENGDTFGSSLATGDFNNDGFADLAVGVPLEGIGTVGEAGAVSVLYGSAARLQATSPDDQFLSQDSTSVKDTAESGDTFGASLGSGDFNNDGFADLAIGVPREDDGDFGAVNVLYGSAGRLQATSPDDQLWSQDTTGVKDTAEVGDAFGFSVAAADFNNDGFADLAIGVPFEGVGTVAHAGAVNVLYGSAATLQAASPDDQFWNQDSTSVKDTAEENDGFGALPPQCFC